MFKCVFSNIETEIATTIDIIKQYTDKLHFTQRGLTHTQTYSRF